MGNYYAEDFRFLNKSMLENNLVVFVGAGCSVGSGFPLWTALSNAIKERMDELKNVEDALIIPQMYYNARGKKDYVELIRELLYKPDATPNAIHERIVKLNPRCIVTTNYDNLLENAFNDGGVFLDVIEKDSDLPYTHTSQMIVKMHGGFRYNNFVLKEDDYLNYSTDFTLIENYIKALFARYTVLFIGYSFNDPDTKQIFNWVRDILKEDQQRAYLINISDKYSSQTYDYYRNIGINVIFAERFENLPENLTERTTFVLDKIIMPESNKLAKINETFKRYDIFNYIPTEFICDTLNEYFRCYCQEDRLIFNEAVELDYKPIRDYFEDESLQKTFPYIKRVLEKSNITRVVFTNSKMILSSDKSYKKEYDISSSFPEVVAFEEFNYSSIEKFIRDETDEISMYTAYCYYYLHDYLNCYKTLRKISKQYLMSKQLDKYLFAENNRIHAGKLLVNHVPKLLPDEKIQQIKEELDNVENAGIYADYPLSAKGNQLLLNLIDFRYIYQKMHEIINWGRKLDKESRTTYFMYAGVPAYDKIEELAKDVYNCLQYNYLLLDAYNETKSIYTLLIDLLLLSLSSNKKNISKDDFGKEYVIVALEKLSKFDIMIILRYISLEELKNIINKYKVDKIILDNDAFLYLKTVLTNLNTEYRNHKKETIFIFRKIFILLKMVDMSQELHPVILESMQLMIKDYANVIEYEDLNSFICTQFSVHHSIFNAEEIAVLIKDACRAITMKNSDSVVNAFMTLLINLIAIYADISSNSLLALQLKDIEPFSTLLPPIVLVHLHKISSDELKEMIVQRVMKYLKSNVTETKIYYTALIKNVIEPIIDCENALFEIAKKEAATIESIFSTSYNISYSATLYLEDKLLDKQRFVQVIQNDKALGLLIEPGNYNYKNFVPETLLHLTDKAISTISNDEIARQNIADSLRKYLLENWNEKLAKIYIKYFGK